MPYNNRDIFSIYDLLSTELDDENNTISSQLGDFTDSKVISSEAEHWQHCGFASRPPNCDSTSDDCPQGICINKDDQDLVIAERDIKSQQIYGNLAAGETCLYATGEDGNGQCRILLKKNGGINLYTKKDNVEAGQGMGIFIDAKADTISIINSVGNGIVIDANGISLIGQVKSASLGGGNVSFGAISCQSISCTSVTAAGIVTAAKLVGSATINGALTLTGAVTPGATPTGNVAGPCSIVAALT